MSNPSDRLDRTNPSPAPVQTDRPDASTKSIIYYALGNIENGVANNALNSLQNIMVVAMHINPLIGGFIVSVKTIIDAITDPVMAHISDNFKSRFGRRKPFVLLGGVSRMLFLIAFFAFFPIYHQMSSNAELAAQDQATAPAATDVQAASARGTEADTGEVTPEGNVESPPPVRVPAKALPGSSGRPGLFDPLVKGFQAMFMSTNPELTQVVIYVLAGIIIFTLLSTMSGVPYFAWGIELCSSYDGRTKLTVYRSLVDKVIGIVNPWVLPFCFSLVWINAIHGLFFLVAVVATVGIATTVLMIVKVDEPKTYMTVSKKKLPLGFFKSLLITLKNRNFLRVFALYQIIGLSNGLFHSVGLYLNIYWVMKGAAQGSTVVAIVGTLGWALSIAAIPFVLWFSKRFQKHNTVLLAVVLMMVGCLLKWWLVTPEAPYLQLVLPIFFSIGISSFYTVMGALLADVTDDDELQTGRRREGMFAAVMSLLGKVLGSIVPVLAGLILVISGFEAALKFDQSEQTILNLRIAFSVVPALMLSVAILLLIRYPLTRERMAQIQTELTARRQADGDDPANP